MDRRIQVSENLLRITVVIMIIAGVHSGASHAQQVSGSSLAAPHASGEYVGLTKCAACHFDQYKDWKGSEHNRAFEILPLKYRTDASCLECHTTGHATDSTSQQFGVSCESCHGPGGEHAKDALRFVNEIITEEGLTSLRGKIQRLDMLQCVKCHVSKAHKKHPPFDREETLPPPASKRSVSFFDRIHSPGIPQPGASDPSVVGSTLDRRLSGGRDNSDPTPGSANVETQLVRDDR